jgi:hypothetical protein
MYQYQFKVACEWAFEEGKYNAKYHVAGTYCNCRLTRMIVRLTRAQSIADEQNQTPDDGDDDLR